jgi:hypothetical protein
MTIGQFLSPATSALRFITSLLTARGRRTITAHKCLEAHLIDRGIVAELPDYLPFHISDDDGNRYDGIYAIGMHIWNRGLQAVTHGDFTLESPLRVSVGKGANLAKIRVICPKDDTIVSTESVDENNVTINFDFLNPGEYLLALLFVTGNPNVDVSVTGRIIGQSGPIDHTAAEVRATPTERLSCLFVLILILNAIPGLFIGGYLIIKRYGWKELQHLDTAPSYLTAPFFLGAMVTIMFITSRIMYWREREKYPDGYPLYADLEPPLLENIKGMLKTIFQAKKQRISLSIFDWGRPILMPSKKTKRPTIDDWFE